MQTDARPKDRYGFPVTPGQRYRLTPPGRPSIIVEVYWNEQSILMTCDLNKKVGEHHRFQSVADVHPHASWVRVSFEGVDIEPDCENRDCDGKQKQTVFDVLCDLESRAYMLKAEQKRLEQLACQAMGRWVEDGSQIAEAAFDLIHNNLTAERCMQAYHQYIRRLEQANGTR